jgi:hypothetical protein
MAYPEEGKGQRFLEAGIAVGDWDKAKGAQE